MIKETHEPSRAGMQSQPPDTRMTSSSRTEVNAAHQARSFHSAELFGAQREVLIEHGGFTYRLNITQANKLILTK